MQDVGQSSSHVLFCTYRSREYRTVIRNVLLFENLMYSKLLSQNVAKKQCIGKKIVMMLRTTTGQQNELRPRNNPFRPRNNQGARIS